VPEWQNSGFAMPSGKLPRTGRFTDSDGATNIFQNNAEAILAFRLPHPGELGIRNNLRGQGFFGTDTGLSKTWKLSESQALKFNWEIYDVLTCFSRAARPALFNAAAASFSI
jgi:hypothetical protein